MHLETFNHVDLEREGTGRTRRRAQQATERKC